MRPHAHSHASNGAFGSGARNARPASPDTSVWLPPSSGRAPRRGPRVSPRRARRERGRRGCAASWSGMSATSPQVRPALSAASPASLVLLWEMCPVDRIPLPVTPLAGSPGTGLAPILLAVRVTSLRCPNGEWDRPGKRSHWRDWRQCQAGRIREIGWSLIWYGRSFTTRIITSSI